MEALKIADMERAGFRKVLSAFDGTFELPGWSPKPLVEFYKYQPVDAASVNQITAFIGALRWNIKTKQDLENFLIKSVPTFCEISS